MAGGGRSWSHRLEWSEGVWEVRKQTMQVASSFKNYGNKGQKTGRQLKRAVSQGRVDFKVTRWGIFTCEWEESTLLVEMGGWRYRKARAEWQPQWSRHLQLGFNSGFFHLLPMWLGAGYLALCLRFIQMKRNGTSIGRIKWKNIWKGWGLIEPLPMQDSKVALAVFTHPNFGCITTELFPLIFHSIYHAPDSKKMLQW